MNDNLRHDWSVNSPEWAYNQPGWKPCCARCHKRKDDCRKFNSNEHGSFAGEWICESCRKDSDSLTPYELVFERKK